MSHTRRILNLIVDKHQTAIRTLRRMDLNRLQLFHPTTPPLKTLPEAESAVPLSDAGSHQQAAVAAGPAASTMKSIRLPNPSFSFEACRTHLETRGWATCCLPLSERKVICMDQCGRSVLFDADTHDVVTMPKLHKPKMSPISLFIPNASASASGDGSLFIMEMVPYPVIRRYDGTEQPCHDFEVLVFHKGVMTCQLLPPPPFLLEHTVSEPSISSYAVVDGGSLICISVNGVGTYVLDTATHKWSKAGDWMLPFHGKVEYVPEFKLWFGLSADAHRLAAADLSTTTRGTQPQLVGGGGGGGCKELHPPEEWMECHDAKFVYLGSGKFCIARFFIEWLKEDDSFCYYHTALTGVQVVLPRANANANGSNREVELQMIPHETRYHIRENRSPIKELF